MSDEPAQAPEGYRYMRGFLVCARCGVLVLDRELHTAWHGRLTGPPVPYRPKTYPSDSYPDEPASEDNREQWRR